MAKRKGSGKVVAIGLGAIAVLGIGALLLGGGDAEAGPPRGDGEGPNGEGGPGGDGGDDPAAGRITFPVFAGTEGADKLREIATAAGLAQDWVSWLMAVAVRESAFTSNVVLGDPALYPTGSVPSPNTASLGAIEAKGAGTAYDRARDQGRLDCPWPRDAYVWGSGGWLGQIPANAWAAYSGTPLACRHPWYLLHPVDQVITAIEYLRRLSGWSAYKADPTLFTARVGWANPSGMDDPQYRESRATKWAGDLAKVGLPPDFGDRPAPALPPKGDVYQRWDALMKKFNFYPGQVASGS